MSRLKPVNTKDPVELREHLEQMSGIMVMGGGSALTEGEINEIVQLHCEEGVSLEDCVERIVGQEGTG